jgi:hypothetical protein
MFDRINTSPEILRAAIGALLAPHQYQIAPQSQIDDRRTGDPCAESVYARPSFLRPIRPHQKLPQIVPWGEHLSDSNCERL